MRPLLGKIAAGIAAIFAVTVAATRTILDIIGYSTAPEDAAAVPGKVSVVLNWLATQPWVIAYGIPLAFIGVSAWLLGAHPRSPESDDITAPPKRQKFILADQTKLVCELKRIAGGDTSDIEISFAAAQHRPLADKLKAVFELAGWEITFNPGPLDSYRHEYQGGIRMAGYNSAHLQAVVDSLKAAGLPISGTEVRALEIPREHVKWPRAQRKVYIVIGHE